MRKIYLPIVEDGLGVSEIVVAGRVAVRNGYDRASADCFGVSPTSSEIRRLCTCSPELNTILETKDSAHGLISNMGDVLFETSKYELKPAARERLARVSGILLAYPSLNVAVEGYTDSTGSDDYNQKLSEQRAEAVRDYLVQAGVAEAAVSAQGFGKAQPVAPNDTADGRQKNRRVELVVSGDAIGTTDPDSKSAPASDKQ
jgi:outer membrane protein OmpA-like peptidoglycan-associated protein